MTKTIEKIKGIVEKERPSLKNIELVGKLEQKADSLKYAKREMESAWEALELYYSNSQYEFIAMYARRLLEASKKAVRVKDEIDILIAVYEAVKK